MLILGSAAVNRLLYELCKYRFDIESNEYLFLNGIFTDFIFNHAKKNVFYFCPNDDSFINYFNEEIVFRKYYFPDIDLDLKNNLNGKFKMTIGDFIDSYKTFISTIIKINPYY